MVIIQNCGRCQALCDLETKIKKCLKSNNMLSSLSTSGKKLINQEYLSISLCLNQFNFTRGNDDIFIPSFKIIFNFFQILSKSLYILFSSFFFFGNFLKG